MSTHPKLMKECNKHEKKASENDQLRLCEICERQYYVCEMCRQVKLIEAPINICLKCIPAMKILRQVLQKKDAEIVDLHRKLKKHESDSKELDELKRQMHQQKKENEELQIKLCVYIDEIEELRQQLENTRSDLDTLKESIKTSEELKKDLKYLLDTQELADTTILCGSLKFKAHKCLLLARSENIRKIIQRSPPEVSRTSRLGDSQSFKNNKKFQSAPPSQQQQQQPTITSYENNKIRLNDLDPEIMPFLLNYLYTGEATKGITEKNILSVMEAAGKLSLHGLKNACLLFMENRISPQTVVKILIDAFELNNEKLKKVCFKFIFEKEVFLENNSAWHHFKITNPRLALDLYESYIRYAQEFYAKNKNDLEKFDFLFRNNNEIDLPLIKHSNK